MGEYARRGINTDESVTMLRRIPRRASILRALLVEATTGKEQADAALDTLLDLAASACTQQQKFGIWERSSPFLTVRLHLFVRGDGSPEFAPDAARFIPRAPATAMILHACEGRWRVYDLLTGSGGAFALLWLEGRTKNYAHDRTPTSREYGPYSRAHQHREQLDGGLGDRWPPDQNPTKNRIRPHTFSGYEQEVVRHESANEEDHTLTRLWSTTTNEEEADFQKNIGKQNKVWLSHEYVLTAKGLQSTKVSTIHELQTRGDESFLRMVTTATSMLDEDDRKQHLPHKGKKLLLFSTPVNELGFLKSERKICNR